MVTGSRAGPGAASAGRQAIMSTPTRPARPAPVRESSEVERKVTILSETPTERRQARIGSLGLGGAGRQKRPYPPHGRAPRENPVLPPGAGREAPVPARRGLEGGLAG